MLPALGVRKVEEGVVNSGSVNDNEHFGCGASWLNGFCGNTVEQGDKQGWEGAKSCVVRRDWEWISRNPGIGSIIQHRCWKCLRLLIGGHYSSLGRGRLLGLTITKLGKEKHKRRARTSKEVLLWDHGGWTKAWSGSRELRIFAWECARNGLLVAETLASSK